MIPTDLSGPFRHALARTRMKQTVFAERAGTSNGSVLEICRGVKKPSLSVLAALVEIGTSGSWLLTGRGAMTDAPESPPSTAAPSATMVSGHRPAVFRTDPDPEIVLERLAARRSPRLEVRATGLLKGLLGQEPTAVSVPAAGRARGPASSARPSPPSPQGRAIPGPLKTGDRHGPSVIITGKSRMVHVCRRNAAFSRRAPSPVLRSSCAWDYPSSRLLLTAFMALTSSCCDNADDTSGYGSSNSSCKSCAPAKSKPWGDSCFYRDEGCHTSGGYTCSE
jgi:hypothetical protein